MPDGRQLGKIDRGIIKKTERRTERPAEGALSISDTLMRLAIIELIKEHDCTDIITEPTSLQGERYAERNGFHCDRMRHKGDNPLDARVLERIRKSLNSSTNQPMDWDELPKIVDKISPTIDDVAKEIRQEQERTHEVKR